jgi:hypothetical protein
VVSAAGSSSEEEEEDRSGAGAALLALLLVVVLTAAREEEARSKMVGLGEVVVLLLWPYCHTQIRTEATAATRKNKGGT